MSYVYCLTLLTDGEIMFGVEVGSGVTAGDGRGQKAKWEPRGFSFSHKRRHKALMGEYPCSGT